MSDRWVVSHSDRELLAHNGLDSFDSLWDLDPDWFEAPNHRRNGWSGVSRRLLRRPEGGECAVFIKRQQNHNFKSLSHPVCGLPTTYREYRNICRLKANEIPCPDLVLYGHRHRSGQWQAILITRALDGYRPLEDCLDTLGESDVPGRAALLASVAATVSRMHAHFLRHSSLYAKHIFVKPDTRSSSDGATPRFDSAVIDLEKMRFGFPVFRVAAHDLDQLYRHWRRREGDWDTFMGSYLSYVPSRLTARWLKRAIVPRGGRHIDRRLPVSDVELQPDTAAQTAAATETVSV